MLALPLVCAALIMSDGDSGRCHLETGAQVRIRLYGMDAPEVRPFTRCRSRPDIWACSAEARAWGAVATNRARALTGEGAVCTEIDMDRYGRRVVTCHVAFGDLGGLLVEEGLAISDPVYVNDYGPAEARARRERRGVWR